MDDIESPGNYAKEWTTIAYCMKSSFLGPFYTRESTRPFQALTPDPRVPCNNKVHSVLSHKYNDSILFSSQAGKQLLSLEPLTVFSFLDPNGHVDWNSDS